MFVGFFYILILVETIFDQQKRTIPGTVVGI